MATSGRGYQVALVLGTLFLIVAAFAAGWTGYWGLQQLNTEIPIPGLSLPGGGEIRPAPPATEASLEDVDMALFWEAMELLDKNYYGQEELPRGDDLTYAAIEGVVAATGDPHTGFLDPERARFVAESLDGSFEGIGAQVEMADEGLTIVAPFAGTPAAEAGLKPGDIVLEVDGQITQGMTVDEAVALVRGPEGTTVNLLVRREGEAELLTFDITRGTIIIPIVESRIIEEAGAPTIGYLKLTGFGGRSVEQFNGALQELLDQGAEQIIVDLRNNPGGFLQASVDITSQFIDEGLILSEKGSNGRDIEHPAEPGGIALDIPLVVLVNEGSASASEIFAGAIRDSGRGTLIGETTFGKGSVQITRDLSDDSNLRITVARWFTPDGNAIHEVGIEPDIVVEWEQDLAAPPEEDPQLQAAIQFFRDQSVAEE